MEISGVFEKDTGGLEISPLWEHERVRIATYPPKKPQVNTPALFCRWRKD
jgi:hypothetical protein